MSPKKQNQTGLSLDQAAMSGLVLLGLARRSWCGLIACAALGTGIAVAYTKSLPRIYQSSTLLEIDPHASHPLGAKMDSIVQYGAGDYTDTQEYYQTQYRIITGEQVMTAVARDLGLANDPDFSGSHTVATKVAPLKQLGKALSGRVSVQAVKGSRLVNIVVEDTNPERAKRICDSVVKNYIEQNREKATSVTADAVAWMTGQIEKVQADLDASENSLHAFKLANQLPSTSINEASNLLRLEMQSFDESLTRTRTKKIGLVARSAELAKVTAENADELPATELLGSAFLQTARGHMEAARSERDALLADGKGESHPQLLQADAKVARAKAALMAEVKNIRGAISRDLAVVEREEIGEAAYLAAARKGAIELNMKEIEYNRLDRSRVNNSHLYTMLLERTKEADLARMLEANNLRVVETADEAGAPIRPRATMNALIGLLTGLFLGVAGVLGKHQLDRSIKTPQELEEKLGIAFLGLVPESDTSGGAKRRRRRWLGNRKADALRPSVELLVHEQSRSSFAEAMRSVRTSIMFMNPDKPHRKLLVTSSAPGEGKTTVACNLAVAMAQAGERVCIVDGDLRRPRIHSVFGRSGQAGLSNVIVGDKTLDDVLRPTEIPNLFCIPAGPMPPTPADLFHSKCFKKLLDELSERFDRVIFDSAPLVPVTDSALISTLMDGTILVLRASATTDTVAQQGLRSLRDLDSQVLGAVLNAVDFAKTEYKYYRESYDYLRFDFPPVARAEEAGSGEIGVRH